ncbi:MAG: hypothetical protein RR342_01455 [Bacilli bacterium]
MIIKKYPKYRDIKCPYCLSEFKLTDKDYKNDILHVYGPEDDESNICVSCKCPICKNIIELNKYTVENSEEVYKKMKNIFELKAKEINALPATDTRKEIAHQLNDLFDSITVCLGGKIDD